MGVLGKNIFSTEKTSMRNYSLKILLVFISIFIVFTFGLSAIITNKAITTMKEKVSALISANTYQQVMNVDNYLQKMKDTTSLFFSDEIYYKYDGTDENMDDFDKIQVEAQILNRIEELGVLESYADFGVIYSDNHKVGWISDGTYDIEKGSKLYATFSEHINGTKHEAAWFASEKNNYNALYYIKRLNDNAILVTSFYSREIETVFEIPNDMQDMIIRLVDENSTVLYSTDRNEIGSELSEDINSLIPNKANCLVLNDKYIVTSNSCNNNSWSVVCSMPADVITKDIDSIVIFTSVVSAVMLIMVIILSLFLLRKVSAPVNNMVKDLRIKANYDQLSGLLNKTSFRMVVTESMETTVSGDFDVFIMLDMDNFKKINDNLGHDEGDRTIMRMSNLIKTSFGGGFISGRIGGDEFAVYIRLKKVNPQLAKDIIESDIQIFRNDFLTEFESEHKGYGLSASIGIAVVQSGDMSFEDIYKSADTALYESKRNGKNQYNFYTE